MKNVTGTVILATPVRTALLMQKSHFNADQSLTKSKYHPTGATGEI
jgi:hypothetical protein